MKKHVLVTGGAGFIGSHTVVNLIEEGYDVTIIDNLSNSDYSVLEAIEEITGTKPNFIKIDLSDSVATKKILPSLEGIDGVIHFAALKSVADSVRDPLFYFKNNLNSTINVLEIASTVEIKNIIFSSSCTVYGASDVLPVSENTPLMPAESPYGSTKIIGEQIIRDLVIHKQKQAAVLLRYFNPAGAHESQLIGESSKQKATNLVPIITETAIGKRSKMQVFGNDYDTRDGTCIRDYIHVMDLASAHIKAFQLCSKQLHPGVVDIINLGIGQGVTVLEAITAFQEVTGVTLNVEIGPRRAGDIPAIYADNTKAKEVLNWIPTRDIKSIMKTAWEWEKARTE